MKDLIGTEIGVNIPKCMVVVKHFAASLVKFAKIILARTKLKNAKENVGC